MPLMKILDDTYLEDKIYLLPGRRLISQNNIWHLSPKSNYSYNFDQYVMTTTGTNGTRSSHFLRFSGSRKGRLLYLQRVSNYKLL